ncbi:MULTISPECIES: hypothetical protein [unclassified Holdemania]|uniref:hypothetical protein n=1 Tax=unclassified Holdemania TaxID=2637685 RepID=UPI0011149F65|nr:MULTISPECIES: hypothetical protein [unclassified Holdemania]
MAILPESLPINLTFLYFSIALTREERAEFNKVLLSQSALREKPKTADYEIQKSIFSESLQLCDSLAVERLRHCAPLLLQTAGKDARRSWGQA